MNMRGRQSVLHRLEQSTSERSEANAAVERDRPSCVTKGAHDGLLGKYRSF